MEAVPKRDETLKMVISSHLPTGSFVLIMILYSFFLLGLLVVGYSRRAGEKAGIDIKNEYLIFRPYSQNIALLKKFLPENEVLISCAVTYTDF